jgi:hypothetical protein
MPIYRPTEAETMEAARIALARTIRRNGGPATHPVPQANAPRTARSRRSLRTCHRPASWEEPERHHVHDTRAYVPELSARIEDDRNLTDGARRCARKLGEYTYRNYRDTRTAEITVTYLQRALRRCRRTVQRYLRQLEAGGYIKVDVVHGGRTRMCVGLSIKICDALLPQHRRDKWPARATNSDATRESYKNLNRYITGGDRRLIARSRWALYCMDGVWRSLQKTIPPLPPLSATS